MNVTVGAKQLILREPDRPSRDWRWRDVATDLWQPVLVMKGLEWTGKYGYWSRREALEHLLEDFEAFVQGNSGIPVRLVESERLAIAAAIEEELEKGT